MVPVTATADSRNGYCTQRSRSSLKRNRRALLQQAQQSEPAQERSKEDARRVWGEQRRGGKEWVGKGGRMEF